jgi:hypothetical protein
LFHGLSEGLRLRAAGEVHVEAAQRLERAVLALERRHAAATPVLSSMAGFRSASGLACLWRAMFPVPLRRSPGYACDGSSVLL